MAAQTSAAEAFFVERFGDDAIVSQTVHVVNGGSNAATCS